MKLKHNQRRIDYDKETCFWLSVGLLAAVIVLLWLWTPHAPRNVPSGNRSDSAEVVEMKLRTRVRFQ